MDEWLKRNTIIYCCPQFLSCSKIEINTFLWKKSAFLLRTVKCFHSGYACITRVECHWLWWCCVRSQVILSRMRWVSRRAFIYGGFPFRPLLTPWQYTGHGRQWLVCLSVCLSEWYWGFFRFHAAKITHLFAAFLPWLGNHCHICQSPNFTVFSQRCTQVQKSVSFIRDDCFPYNSVLPRAQFENFKVLSGLEILLKMPSE